MIEEIKHALEKATPDWYDNGNEIVSKQNLRVGIGGFLKDEDNHLAANAPEWLRYLLGEVERLETKYYVDMNNYRSKVQTWQEQHDSEIVTLSKQVEELQQALEWYADRLNYSGPHSAVWQDEGNQARQALERTQP